MLIIRKGVDDEVLEGQYSRKDKINEDWKINEWRINQNNSSNNGNKKNRHNMKI